MNKIESMKGRLIVSCQALEDEPLYGPMYMAKMARAAWEGGASGIRANSIVDIQAIKKEVPLPIIGIIKRDFDTSSVRITPTYDEVKALVDEGVDIIAMDATARLRPGNISLESFFSQVKAMFPNQLFMADVSNVQEAIEAKKMGFDIIATTLVGYTDYTEGDDPLSVLKEIIKVVKGYVIAEGNINQPEKARQALEEGAFAVVVGSAITRPQYITNHFVNMMKGEKS